MAAQKGSAVLIKVGDGASPTENFATVAGLRITRFVLNNQLVDATNRDSGAWRQLLEGAGIRSLTLTGSGVFTDAASEQQLRGYAFDNSIHNYECHFGNGDRIGGAFMIASYERAGEYDGEETYALALESAGAVTYAAA